jgi:hypothetical protein
MGWFPWVLTMLPKWFMWGSLGAALIYGTYLIRDYGSVKEDLARRDNQVKELRSQILVLEANNRLSTKTIDILNERIAQRAGELEDFCRILNDVAADTSPGADDSVGSPVDKVLEELKKREAK